MSRVCLFILSLLGLTALMPCGSRGAISAEVPSPVEVVISVADQKMAVLREGGLIARYPVSTSKFGTGDGGGSYKTPLGRLKVCEKLGESLAPGTVIKHRQATNEVLPANAPGRDPIVTRILWLEGCESQNANARARSIYIHGTPEEHHLGKPVSWGCVRMRSEDVIALYEALPVGSSVTIIPDRLPRYPKYVAPKPEIIIAKKEEPAPAAPTKTAPSVAAAPAKPAPAPVAAVASAKPAPAPVVAAASKPAPAPAPIAALENPRKVAIAARAAAAPPAAETIRRVEPIAAAAVPAAKRTTEVAVNTPAHKSASLLDSLHTSILLSGVDANSEMPQLRQ